MASVVGGTGSALRGLASVTVTVDDGRVTISHHPQGITVSDERESGVTSGVAETTQSEAAVMASTAQKFDDVNGQLQQMLATLMNELQPLQHSWKGLGATAFEGVRAQYGADLKALNQALSETAAAIRESGRGYTSTDADAASNLTSGGGGLSLPL
jgi:WXG100 family type VII secretion target